MANIIIIISNNIMSAVVGGKMAIKPPKVYIDKTTKKRYVWINRKKVFLNVPKEATDRQVMIYVNKMADKFENLRKKHKPKTKKKKSPVNANKNIAIAKIINVPGRMQLPMNSAPNALNHEIANYISMIRNSQNHPQVPKKEDNKEIPKSHALVDSIKKSDLKEAPKMVKHRPNANFVKDLKQKINATNRGLKKVDPFDPVSARVRRDQFNNIASNVTKTVASEMKARQGLANFGLKPVDARIVTPFLELAPSVRSGIYKNAYYPQNAIAHPLQNQFKSGDETDSKHSEEMYSPIKTNVQTNIVETVRNKPKIESIIDKIKASNIFPDQRFHEAYPDASPFPTTPQDEDQSPPLTHSQWRDYFSSLVPDTSRPAALDMNVIRTSPAVNVQPLHSTYTAESKGDENAPTQEALRRKSVEDQEKKIIEMNTPVLGQAHNYSDDDDDDNLSRLLAIHDDMNSLSNELNSLSKDVSNSDSIERIKKILKEYNDSLSKEDRQLMESAARKRFEYERKLQLNVENAEKTEEMEKAEELRQAHRPNAENDNVDRSRVAEAQNVPDQLISAPDPPKTYKELLETELKRFSFPGDVKTFMDEYNKAMPESYRNNVKFGYPITKNLKFTVKELPKRIKVFMARTLAYEDFKKKSHIMGEDEAIRETSRIAKAVREHKTNERVAKAKQASTVNIIKHIPGSIVDSFGSEYDADAFMAGLPKGSGKDIGGGLYSDQIIHMMAKIPNFLGVIALDEIPLIVRRIKPHTISGWISNLDTSDQPGSHWVAVVCNATNSVVDGHSIMYYDPFGRDIPEAMQKELLSVAEKVDPRMLMKLKISRVQHQDIETDNCGYFSMKFLIDILKNHKSFAQASGFTDRIEDKSKKYEKQIEELKQLPPFNYVQKGGSIIDKLINSGIMPEMHYRSPFSGKKFNFAGPFTKLEKRLDKNNKPLPGSIPVNRVDESAYHHDLAYNMLPDHESRKVADNTMIDDLNMIRNDKNAHWAERADALLIEGIMRGKRFLGLGKEST